MNKQTLLINTKYIIFGLIVALSVGFIHADFPSPTATPPGANIATPLHTGPDQVKDAGLSVNTFLANQNAAFKQQTFLNGTVFGGNPGDATSTVVVGDTTLPANIAVNGNLSAASFIQSTSVANASSSNLCASPNGTIVTCTGPVTATTPTLKQVGGIIQQGSTTVQAFSVGPSVGAGDTFSITIYYHTVTVTAVAGDSAESIAQKMIVAINNTTDAQWRENPYLGTTSRPGDPNVAPPAGTPGYMPSAASTAVSASNFIVTLDGAHQVVLYGAQ